MNCINHPEKPVASYCQNCGKGLCTECTRPVGGFLYCEQCLAAKVGVPGAQPGAPFPPAPSPGGPNPGLATLLGFIPGVGAMYNGQFVKAMIHVLVFVVLIAIAGDHGPFGILIFAWVVYQVFDANQTAKARRDGLPLPDPFGLNELAIRLGGNQFPGGVPPSTAGSGPAAYTAPNPTASSFAGGAYPPPPGSPYPPPGVPYTPPGGSYAPPPPNVPYSTAYPEVPPFVEPAKRNEPAGAIALIVLGLLFLFGTLGVFRFDWIYRGWPIILIAMGIWLFLKRARETRPGGGL